ncbi:hypothetical protein ENSA5_65110 [Enhygromyxa salina]|uniref:Uncharacterized protein n=1 Tax=Enhygromyxa salina TaxID=215803 RepID=A0A2S9XC39_9BACT|nr:hypothetical protein ENSA5_65110 [Enhygromyxa salina]
MRYDKHNTRHWRPPSPALSPPTTTRPTERWSSPGCPKCACPASPSLRPPHPPGRAQGRVRRSPRPPKGRELHLDLNPRRALRRGDPAHPARPRAPDPRQEASAARTRPRRRRHPAAGPRPDQPPRRDPRRARRGTSSSPCSQPGKMFRASCYPWTPGRATRPVLRRATPTPTRDPAASSRSARRGRGYPAPHAPGRSTTPGKAPRTSASRVPHAPTSLGPCPRRGDRGSATLQSRSRPGLHLRAKSRSIVDARGPRPPSSPNCFLPPRPHSCTYTRAAAGWKNSSKKFETISAELHLG